MNLFEQVKITKPQTNLFDLSHERKMSLNMGKLYPILVQEVVPGDKFRVSTEILMRMAPLTAPVMHRVNVFTHYFYVPNRIIWDEFQDFITGGEQGDKNPVAPYLTIGDETYTQFYKKSLADYMGLPVTDDFTGFSNETNISSLPFRAYQTIYNEYYRDQNLIDKVIVPKTSGSDYDSLTDLCMMRTRAWEKDYFTSCLSEAQKGPEVGVPVDFNYKDQSEVKFSSNGQPVPSTYDLQVEGTDSKTVVANNVDIRIENLETDSVSYNINELRRATKLQAWYEKANRGGTRFYELIRSFFGVKTSDARLQRPEFLGGGRTPITISEVLQTSQTDTSPQGNMAGHGIGVGQSHRFNRTFEEHGWIIGIMSVLPRTAYSQGIPRAFTKFDKFDYYWPEFANLGEQEVLRKELYYDMDAQSGSGNQVFGYQSRYAEYKYNNSTIHGDFRDNLRHWQWGRHFANTPQLNETFINCVPSSLPYAVTDPDEDKLYCMMYHDIKAIRPMPKFGTPIL